MAPERGHDATVPRGGGGRLGEHLGVAHVRAAPGVEGRAMRRCSRTGVFAGGLSASLVMALAPLTPAPAPAHDQSYSYIDLDWQADPIASRVSAPPNDAGAVPGLAAPDSLTSASLLAPPAR